MDDRIVTEIKKKLDEIEKRENVRIIYACESGSRAWGFASKDSDYDVRFVYIRPLEEYLRLDNPSDVIEAELNEIYDINGWDLKKLFGLLYKSNPVIFEWSGSPVIYKKTSEWEKVREILSEYFIESAALHHYKGMAKSNIRSNFTGSEIKLKKYLYVLRPVLACRWILDKHSAPPTEFDKLFEEELPEELKETVLKILEVKMNADESKTGFRNEDLDRFMEIILNETEDYSVRYDGKNKNDWEPLNRVFFDLVKGE